MHRSGHNGPNAPRPPGDKQLSAAPRIGVCDQVPKRRLGTTTFSRLMDAAGTDISDTLKADLIPSHHGTKGQIRDEGLRTFLRRVLPQSYEVSSGFSFDAHDQQSHQIDIIISQAAPFRKVLQAERVVQLPCEVLLSVVEAKYKLDIGEIRDCLTKAQSIRSLRPYSTGRFVCVPTRGTETGVHEFRCLFTIIAFDSDLVEGEDYLTREWERYQTCAADLGVPADILDRIVILRRGIINCAKGVGSPEGALTKNAGDWLVELINFLERERDRRPKLDWDIYTKSRDWRSLRNPRHRPPVVPKG